MSLFLNFDEALNMLETTKPVEMLWNGVKENSFGLVFGPPKSGKTIFCENLAISFALGRKDFMGYPINTEPQKVMFIGLEEFWRNRFERNAKQFSTLSDDEKELFKNNFIVPDTEFPKTITTNENWELLRKTIQQSGANTVFIDSITRMNHGKIEDSKTAEEICLKLRNLSQDLNISLFVIHHTPKLGDEEISMDKIKGSTVFSQESDFAIGINRTSGNKRYMKNIFFRYADDSDDSHHEFELDENLIVNYKQVSSFINFKNDRRVSDNRELMANYFKENPSQTLSTKECVDYFTSSLNIRERQVKSYLSELVELEAIVSPNRGLYQLKGGCNE
jgi:archaellum biogenesis ATPase FlaH